MPDLAWTRLLERLAEGAPRPGESIPEMRANFERAAAEIPMPHGVVVEPVQAGEVVAEWLRPSPMSPGRAILYLHGGGYILGSLATHRSIGAHLALHAGVEVLSIDYRLAPEHVFPAAVHDAVAAFAWLRSVRPGARLAIAGDSAGGGLAVAALVAMRDAGVTLPCAAVCMSPWCDLGLAGATLDTNEGTDPQVSRWLLTRMAQAYLAETGPTAPFASPIHADLSGLPPMLIQVGGAEVLLDDGRRLAEVADRAGVDVTFECWEDMFHVWHALAPRLPDAERALVGIGAWLNGIWTPAN